MKSRDEGYEHGMNDAKQGFHCEFFRDATGKLFHESTCARACIPVKPEIQEYAIGYLEGWVFEYQPTWWKAQRLARKNGL